ncbi:hypothetical protein F0562_023661 [Nyssa sinensis]|uniref:Remorin C-terminal domain-containing protein n=1 Tax=Nyssa sinensis TaxID=561372 RepID=A0A5J5BIC1_9ASTE|nr:hypothetical protein F0562_023661 [Nyssa sinensis]
MKNWLQRQFFSSQMSWNYDSGDNEFATAAAAAAYAIYSLEQASSQYQKKLREGLETPMTKVKTRKEDPSRLPEFSSKEEKDAAVGASMRKATGQDSESHPSSVRPAIPGTGDQKQEGNSTRPRSIETKADAWEKTAMENIKKRYEKMSSVILAWENEKKMKAKLRMERKKRELEQRRARNLHHYQNKLASIDHLAGGARAQIEEKRRSEESVVKEKAKKIRSTGEVPGRWFCF